MIKMKMASSALAAGFICLSLINVQCNKNTVMPAGWRSEWRSPGVVFRPLQIVHGADIRTKASYYKDTCGLGGVVCNVPFGVNYLKSEEEWKTWVEGVKEIV